MPFIKEVWAYVRTRKKYWLVPILIVMMIFGWLIVFGSGSALGPFIYTLY